MKQLIMAAGLAVMLTACGTSEKKTVEGGEPVLCGIYHPVWSSTF